MKQYRNDSVKKRYQGNPQSGGNLFFGLMATGLSLILLFMPATVAALGLDCSVTATDVAFGNYDPTVGSPTDAVGNVRVDCSVFLVSVLSTINTSLNTGGSGSFSPRKMSSGANQLSYNLYKEASHTTVWGDGTGGTGIFTDTLLITALGTTINHPIYGRIPAGQFVPAGSYRDPIIVVTVEFHEVI